MMERTKQIVDRVLGWGLIALMAIAVANVLWQVFARFALGDPSSMTEEIARYLLIWIGVLGAGYGVGQHDHLALELLPERLTGQKGNWLQIAIQVLIGLFAVWVLIGGGVRLVYLQLNYGQTSAALKVPVGYVYTVLPLSGLSMVFYVVYHINEHVRALRDEDRSV